MGGEGRVWKGMGEGRVMHWCRGEELRRGGG